MVRDESRQDSIMLVDDDPDLCVLVGHWLGEAGYRVEAFQDGESCLAGLARLLPDCICLDLQLPGLSGLETLERVKAHHPRLPVVVLTADSNVETVVSTVQAGAHDYLVKPIDRPKLLTTLHNAIEHYRMSMRLAELEREVEGSGYAGLVGRSPAMKALFRQMDRVASSDITVLIRGESGTGKELVARALHENSGRRDGAFVPVNCAAIPETLEESEFFGHEKGSFTGATGRRTGHVEQAHRGTLFLDEIGELSMGLQAKLLRVLQERRFQRVGGSNELSSDFRLIAATHRDLEAEVRAGRFREDLFFRVAVFELDLPPLRDRGDDVQILADRFLDDFARREEGDRPELAEETRRVLRAYPWPGNVRELQNAMDRARLVAREGRVRPRDLPRRIVGGDEAPRLEPEDAAVEGNGAPESGTGPEAAEPVKSLEEIERDAIAEALERTGGNLSEVVRQLGIGRTTLYRKLKKYGLR